MCLTFVYSDHIQGQRQPFISFGHDVLDGKRKNINGLTIFYTHPKTLNARRVPIALTPPLGNSALCLSRDNLHGLQRAGVEFEDLYRSINDNCSVAKATGVL